MFGATKSKLILALNNRKAISSKNKPIEKKIFIITNKNAIIGNKKTTQPFLNTSTINKRYNIL